MTKVPSPRVSFPFAAARRVGAFGPADGRGNNPHGTRESAEHEGRRLNAQRYETVGQMEAALDANARQDPFVRSAKQGMGFLTVLLVGGAALFALHALSKGKDDDDGDDGDDDLDDVDLDRRVMRQNPMSGGFAPASSSGVPGVQGVPVVMFVQPPASFQLPGQAQAAAIPSEVLPPPVKQTVVTPAVEVRAPVVEIVEEVKEKPKKKKRLKNKGQFTSRTGKAARALVQRPGPKPKGVAT